MTTNQNGQIAIAYYQPAPVLVQASKTATGNEYVFHVSRAVSLAWVDPADAESLLALRGGCCGKRKQLFSYATPGQVSVWANGARGPDTNGGGCGCG